MKSYTSGITKDEFVSEMKLHQKLDNFIKGTYDEGEKGCAVGCSIKSISKLKNITINFNDHVEMENNGICPEWLARLEDTIFEGLSVERSKKWPVEFAEAINIGANLDNIKTPFIKYILDQNLKTLDILEDYGDEKVRESIELSKKAVEGVIKAIDNSTESAESAQSAAWSAQSAAWFAQSSAAWSVQSAADSAARSAAWSADSAAWSAAWSADSAVDSAAWSAAWSARSAVKSAVKSAVDSAARSAAWSAYSAADSTYEKYAEELLRLIRSEV